VKVYRAIMLFSDVELLVAGLELQNDKATIDCPIYILDDHWPLNRAANLEKLEWVKKRWPQVVVVTAPHNMGIHHGFNYLCSQMPLEEDDLILVSAPDSCPLEKGWDQAMVTVLSAAPDLVYVGTNSEAIDKTPDMNWAFGYINGVKFKGARDRPAMFHSTGFKWSFLKSVGGFDQPTTHYGHLESVMWQKMLGQRKCSGYLEDFNEDFRLCNMHPQVYNDYKLAQAHTFTFSGSFEAYLKSINYLS
jgi:GT2 family glycosyltransferase